MSIEKKIKVTNVLKNIFDQINVLRETFENRRQFTIDGRLVGDIGEVIAELDYEIELDEKSQHNHDATFGNGKRVQIKATFQDKLSFTTTPDFYLGLQLFEDGSYKEIYNGPGSHIYDAYSHRKGIGQKQLSFPITNLQKIHEEKNISLDKRVPKRITK